MILRLNSQKAKFKRKNPFCKRIFRKAQQLIFCPAKKFTHNSHIYATLLHKFYLCKGKTMKNSPFKERLQACGAGLKARLKKPSKKTLLIAFALLAVLFGAYRLFFKQDDNAQLITQSITRKNIEQSIEAYGAVYAKKQVDVGAQVSGQITKLYVKIGDSVKSGDLIAQIDKDKQENEFEITKAQLESAKANLASKEVALNIASSQYQREQKLYNNKATSLESLETLKNNFFTLKANVAELKAQIIQLEIQLKNAEKDLSYTTITAPMDGIIINVAVEEGQSVRAGDIAPTIVRVADLNEMEIRMEIAEADVNKIKIGTAVKFSLLDNPEKKYEAQISSIDPADTTISDASSNSSSSTSTSSSTSATYYYAKVFVKNVDNFLRIGMGTENSIVIASAQNALSVPTYAIKNDKKGYYVELLKGEQIIKSYVKIGIRDSINTQILEGANENDTLILSGAATSAKKSSGGGMQHPPMR